MDLWLFHRIHGALHEPPWGSIFGILTHLGDPEWVFRLALLGWLEAVWSWVKGSKGSRGEVDRRPLLITWAGIPCTAWITGWLKAFFHRPRPFEVLPELRAVSVGAGEAFPSGHASLAFALATALSYRWPRLSMLWMTLAVGVALSRVALGVHWPADVLAGILVGSGIVGSLAWLERRLRRRWFA